MCLLAILGSLTDQNWWQIFVLVDGSLHQLFEANSLSRVKKSKTVFYSEFHSIHSGLSVSGTGIPDSLSCSPDFKAQVYSPFTWKNPKLRFENHMVRTIAFGNLQKMWAVICTDTIFLLVLVCSADLIYSVAVCSPSGTSNFIVLCLCTGIPPGWFV